MDTIDRIERTNQRKLWPLGILALLCLAFYWDTLWLPADHMIAGNDLTNMFRHWLRFATRSIRHGQFPLWNPYLFSGHPFVANPQPALFYPPTWLALLMPVTRALGMIILLHVWLVGAGMYAWLRSEGASAMGALFGAVVFAFSGYFFVRVYAGHLGVITTGAWLPTLLWVYRHAVLRRSWKLAVVGGLPVGLSILAGHTASFIYVALGLGAYAIFCAWESQREERSKWAWVTPLLWAGVMLLVGVMLAAVQLLPMAELAMRSARQATANYEFATRFSWPPGYLLTLLVPNFFGEPAQTGYWGEGVYDELMLYVGVLPLLLALLGSKLRHRLKPFLIALGLGALLLALGEHSIIYRLFYRFLPIFRVTRAPARAGFLFTLTAAALAGLMVTTLQETAWSARERLLGPLQRSMVLTVTGFASLLIVTGFMAFAWGRDSNPAAGRLWHLANQTTLFLVFFLLASILLMIWRKAENNNFEMALAALGLTVLDLWTFGGSAVASAEVQESNYWRVVNSTLRETAPDPQAMRVLTWGLTSFEQNGGMAFELRSIFGYDPLMLQRYEEFVASRPDPRARSYDLLNAGYLVSETPQDFPEDQPNTPQLVQERSGVYIYERPTALPRAWVTSRIEVMDEAAMLDHIHSSEFDPRTTALLASPVTCSGAGEAAEVEIVDYEENRIEARVQGGGGLLIFSELDYPGWRATVDGEPTPLVRADYLLRALCVPAGEHLVVLTYDPPLLKIGLVISGLTLLSVISMVIWTGRRENAR